MLRKRFYYIIFLLFILLGIGTLFYYYAEGWSIVDSFYFSTITLTTIGYGDIAPTTDGAKIFTAFYAMFGVGVMLYTLSSVIGAFIFRQGRYFENGFFIPHKPKQRNKRMKKQGKYVSGPKKR